MNKIINTLKKEKSIPLDRFINISLYDKKSGYYIKKNPLGASGDFVTSPIISNLFGEMIAIWCIAFWEYLKKPKKIVIVELGPGDGSLSANLLDAFKKFHSFYDCVEINLLEISKKLKKIQKKKIKDKKVKWISKIEEIKQGPIIFVGNEFFDALPIKQIYKKNNLFFEKFVALSNNKKIIFSYKKANKKLINNIKKFELISSSKIIEYPIGAIKFMEKIAKKIKKYDGGILAIDYGYTKNKNKNTMRAIRKHRFVDVFSRPGNSDISTHINFNLLYKILKKNDLKLKKVTTQNEFLQKMGIIERANILSKKMDFKSKANMYFRLKRLLDRNQMGILFKVLFAQNKKNDFSIGF